MKLPRKFLRLRFSLRSLLILTLGVAIGYTLNLRTWQLLTGAASEARKMTLPTYVIEPPDVLSIEVAAGALGAKPVITGEHLVAMDGRVNLGDYGSVHVAGMTIEEARDAIAEKTGSQIESPQATVDVIAYNSKVYYVILKGGPGFGDSVSRMPITGNETVLDAIASLGGISQLQSPDMWIARPSSDGGSEQILTVNWPAIATGADAQSNYQLFPCDRLIIDRKLPAVTPAAARTKNNPYSAADESDDRVMEAVALQYDPSQLNAPSTPPDVELPNYYQFVRPQLDAQRNASARDEPLPATPPAIPYKLPDDVQYYKPVPAND